MTTKNAIKNFHSLAVRRVLSQAPTPITQLEKELDIPREDLETALADIEEATETKDGWVTTALTTEQHFRNNYGFTPTKKQMEVLRKDNNALVFWQLSYQWRGVSAIASNTGLTQKAVRESLKELNKQELAHGLDDVWIRDPELDDIELARTQILEFLIQPRSGQEIRDNVDRFDSDINNAIALLMQEGLITQERNKIKINGGKS